MNSGSLAISLRALVHDSECIIALEKMAPIFLPSLNLNI